MELIRGLHNLRERHRGCVVSIGNFDGFHRGHQALVARLRERAAQHRLPAAVLSFEPMPREFFAPDTAPGRIATFRDKLGALAGAGVDRLVIARFGRALASMSAEDFIQRVLVEGLGARAVIVGDDFRFGAKRRGDLAMLQATGAVQGFTAEALGTVQGEGERISSSAVRAALAAPDLAKVERLLGRPYRMSGRVRRGLQLGRTLGMPTLNLPLRRRPALRFGVYAVRARSLERQWNGVASLGVRPTLANGPGSCLLETHLFAASGDFYGAPVEVEFRRFLRPELKFDSLPALAEQMRKDGEEAKAWLETA